jgi:hypothetical protein
MSYTLIERKELISSASSISFDGIPQIYTDLIVKMSLRYDGTPGNAQQPTSISFNGSGSSKTSRYLRGDGSSPLGLTYTELYDWIPTTTTTANTFSNGEIYIPNYTGSTNKSASIDSVIENNGTSSWLHTGALLWSNTAAITSIQISGIAYNFVAGSSISLYGINRQQGIGIPKALGGQISFVNGYWVHTFTGSGSFSAREKIQAEYLVVAGGGGGGGDRAGGGGAGGYRSSVIGELSGANSSAESRLIMEANTSHVVTVGAGGTGGGISSGYGTNGQNSSIGSIVSLGGGGGAGGFVVSGATPSGGSGGGSGGQDGGFGLTGGAGTSGQGFKGGDGIGSPFHAAGGGGASAAGGNAGGSAGAGGAGLLSSITGSPVARAGGGGGGANNSSAHGAGGIGGGGAGGKPPVDGTAGTGGGAGGGGNFPQFAGANGGSGIVIIRYKA